MYNLLPYNNVSFTARIKGTKTHGKIRVENDIVYLCQNKISGANAKNKLGYKYSWYVNQGTEESLLANNVTDFHLTFTKSEIEEYKDWQVGDILINCGRAYEFEVIFRSGELVVCKTEHYASANHTCEELHNKGWRLKYTPVEEEPVREVTIDEIAKLLGISADKVHIKKEE